MDTRNIRDILTQMQKTLECSICLELLSNPVSTKCDHQFCSFCITKFLQSKRSVPCPLCKKPVTKRGIQERSELSIVINNVKQLIAAYEADTNEKFTPSKTYREVLPTTHNRKANRKQASDRQVKTTTQTPDCQNLDICHGDSGSSSVPVGESTGLHSPVTDSVPRTRSRRRSQIVSTLADTVVSRAAEESSRRQSNGDSTDINGHRRPGRKRKLSFQSVTSDNDDKSIVGQAEKLNNNFDEHGVHKRRQGDKDNEHHVSSADILCYLEEGSCGAVLGVISANGNENYEHMISASGWEVNSKQEPAESNQKCENIPQSANRRTPCKNMNKKKSVLKSSKAQLPDVMDSSNPMPNFPILSTGFSQNIDTDKTSDDTEPKRNKVLKHDSELDLLPLSSNSETVEDVCKAVSSSSEASSVSSTQQLLKPKPVTARTYSRDMRKSFHDSFVKNWAETLPDKNTNASNSINQPKGLTTKEKIYTKKQKRPQPTRLKEKVTNESNIFNSAETVITNSDSLHHPAKQQAMFEPPLAQVQNRKSIFKTRIESTGNKNSVLNTTLSGDMDKNEDPFEFKVGHTPVKPKRKIIRQQNELTNGKSKEDVSSCKSQNKNKKMSTRKCEVALERVSVSKQKSAHDSTMPSLSSTEVERINKAGVSKAIEKHGTSSHVQKKTVHFDHDLVDVDTDVQPMQGNMSAVEANMISAEINATLALDSQSHQHCTQNEVVDAQKQIGLAAVSLSHSVLKATEVEDLQPVEDTLNPDKNVSMNQNKANLVNESTQFQDISVDVTLKEAPHTFRNKQKNKTQQSPDGDASCLLPDSRKVSAAVQKRKFARRKRKPTCPDTETFSQKAGKELIKLIHKINEAEDYELMFSTQDVQKKLQEDLHKEQVLKEAFGFATQDSDDCRCGESNDETGNNTANNVTEIGHTERQEIVDQAGHIEQIDMQENPVSPNANHSTNSAMNRLEKTNTFERSTGPEASNIGDKPVSVSIDNVHMVPRIDSDKPHVVASIDIDKPHAVAHIDIDKPGVVAHIDIDRPRVVPHIDIDKPGVVAHIDISTDGKDDCPADYHGEGRLNSTLPEPVELSSSHINQMLQQKNHISLQTKQHAATTPVEAKRARVFPRPNFSGMVQVSPCAKGVLTPTKPTLISSSLTVQHSSHMGAVSAKTSTANISICEQSPANQEGSYCDQYVDSSKIQSSLTSNISARNKVKKAHESPGFKAMHMHSRISNDNIPDLDSTVFSTCASKDFDGKFPMRTETKIRKTVNTTQLSLKSKNTEAAIAPPGRNSERAANDALGCDVILAPDTCIYSSTCRTTSGDCNDVEEEAGVILETLDFDTNFQHTNYDSEHIVLSQHSPLRSNEFDKESTLTTVTTTNRTNEEAIAESQNLTTCSTQGPVMFLQDSVPTKNMHEEFSSSCWIDSKKAKMAYPDTAALINLSSEEKKEKKKKVTQPAAIIVTSQETSSGCSSISQSILLPTGANDLQRVHKNDISQSDNICSRFQKPSVDKNSSACDNQSKPLCLAVPETPINGSSPKNKISSAPCRITCSESEDEDYMLIIRRRKRKSFSLDGSPVKAVVFGCEQKLLEEELAPGTKNDECDVDMIGETEAMRAIDAWTQRDMEDSHVRMSDSCVSESLQCQQEETMYLNVLRGTEENASNTGQTVHKIYPELQELPTGRLQCIDSSRKFVSSLNNVNSDPFSKPKSPKRLFSPTSETRLTRGKTNKQHENNSSDHRDGIAVIEVNDNVNEDSDQNKLSQNVETYVPETNDMSQDDDDNSHNSSNNSINSLLTDTGLGTSLLENAAETSATDSRTVSCDLKKGKQTKRGLAKRGSLNLDTSVKHPNSLLSPAAKAVIRSGVEKLTDQRIVHKIDTDVILIDTEEEDTVGVTGQNRTQAEATPGGSRKCDSDLEIANSGNMSRRRRKVKKLPVETKMRKPKVKATENKYYDPKKQLEKELFGVDSKKKLSSEEEKDRNQEMPADHTRNAFAKDVEKTECICAGIVDDEGDVDLLFDLGDSSDDEVLCGGHVTSNARSVENQSQKSEGVGQLDDSVCMSGSPPVTSSPMEAGHDCLEHETIDQSVITAVDETDVDDEDSMYMRPKSRVKRLQIVSDSEDSNQEAIPVRGSANCTSSSALSSQSEILNTEQQEALEEDVAKLHQQIAEYEAKLGQESAALRLTSATQEERACPKASTDAALTSDDADEDSDDLFVSPLSPSPPPQQPSIKSVPKRPAHSKPNRQSDMYIKQFQSPGGTVRTKKSLDFTINTASSHSQGNNVTKANLPPSGNKESNIKNVLQKQSSNGVLHDITHKNIVFPDADKRDEVIDMVESSGDRLTLSPVILSQRSRQIMYESDKREVTGSMTSRCLKDVCLVASALGREEYLLVMKLAEKYGLKLTSKFSTEVTHVVMKPASGYDRVCDRTLKFFQGMAYKCWVVAFPWVQDSLQTGSLLPEEDYEIVGDTSGGENTFGVRHSRLSKEHLFTDFCLACVGDSSEMPKESLRELLTVCGASVVDDPIGLLSKVARYKIIVRCSDSNIAPTTAELDMFNGLYKHMGLLTVMREWVLDSLGSYKLQPLIEYVINTGVTSVPF